jgi:uncharacterized protein with beta-barrel porin domain
MLVTAVAGYGRRAYGAVGCVPAVAPNYQCSGANVTTQTITANNASVSTVAGFSVNTPAGNAITITGDGALSYTDTNASPLTAAAGSALIVNSLGDFGAPGSITINTNGVLSGSGNGKSGIGAYNSGSGAVTVTANGNVTASNGFNGIGINAFNANTASTTLRVTTAAGTTVSGGTGVLGSNYGTGALTVTANGNVTGITNSGINLTNYGTNLTVTTGAGTTVSGGAFGITASNQIGSTGAVTITANGNVTGTANSGISAQNRTGTDLTVTTAAGTTVSGGAYGILARNNGTGAVTITANGDVTGTSGSGIYAHNANVHSTDLTVTTAAGTTVSGGGNGGIFAGNSGTGALTITANGNVTGTSARGISFSNSGTDVTVTTGAGTTVSGATGGIGGRNFGTGALTITANGNVTGTGAGSSGISVVNYGTNLSVTIGAGATVSGSADGINVRNLGTGPTAITVAATGTVSGTSGFGIRAQGSPANVTVAGTVNGGAGGAIQFDQAGAFANRLDLVTGAVINGNVLGGPGTDTLGLSGTGSGSFNVAQLVSFEAGQKTGSGSWTLTGANTGITAFSVGAGTLFVNGSLSNAAFTVSGGTLGGTGTVGNTQINAGATFAPGSGTPGSFMTVNGTLGLNAAATYLVNVNPTTASFATVSGAATLGGATVNAIFANGSYISKQYTILTAGSVSGSFGTLTNTNLPANTHDTLSYDATHAYLNLILNFTTPAPGGLSGNQNNVANALINFFNTTGGIPVAFSSLNANGLTQVSGESATGSQQTTLNAMNQFMGLLTDPFIDGRGDGVSAGGTAATSYASTQKTGTSRDAYAMFTKAPPAVSFEQRWSVWAAGYGGSQTSDGNAGLGSSTATSRIAGTAVGADYRISPFTIAGFALAGGGTSFGVNGLGSGRSDLFQAGAFVRHTVGPAYLSAALAYGWQDITTDRTVTIAGVDRLRAQFNANAFSGRAEGGYRLVAPWIGGLGITPYAAAQFTSFDLPAYAEQVVSGANTFALAYGAKSVTAPRSEIGARTDKSWALQNAILTLRGRVAWAYDYNTDRAIGATFQALPGASFVVNGAAQSHDKALTTASAEMKWINGWSAAATFEGEFSDVSRSYAGKGVVRYQW